MGIAYQLRSVRLFLFVTALAVICAGGPRVVQAGKRRAKAAPKSMSKPRSRRTVPKEATLAKRLRKAAVHVTVGQMLVPNSTAVISPGGILLFPRPEIHPDRRTISLGSGFGLVTEALGIAPDKTVPPIVWVTNDHVIAAPHGPIHQHLLAQLPNGREVELKVVARARHSRGNPYLGADLAWISPVRKDHHASVDPLRVAKEMFEGEPVYSAGYPLGRRAFEVGSVREVTPMGLRLTDMVLPGLSGAAVANPEGACGAVVNLSETHGITHRVTGNGIPMSIVRAFFDRAVRAGANIAPDSEPIEILPNALGIGFIGEDRQRVFNLQNSTGAIYPHNSPVRVTAVNRYGPFGGLLKPGDHIERVGRSKREMYDATVDLLRNLRLTTDEDKPLFVDVRRDDRHMKGIETKPLKSVWRMGVDTLKETLGAETACVALPESVRNALPDRPPAGSDFRADLPRVDRTVHITDLQKDGNGARLGLRAGDYLTGVKVLAAAYEAGVDPTSGQMTQRSMGWQEAWLRLRSPDELVEVLQSPFVREVMAMEVIRGKTLDYVNIDNGWAIDSANAVKAAITATVK